jgi:hypothetical protein
MLPKPPTILLRHGVTMSRSSSALLPLPSHSTSLATFILCLLLAPSFLSPSAFAQGSKQKSGYDPVQEADKDSPDKRAEWNMRGREVPKGESAAALRLRAHQQKMAMRAQREAAAKAQPAQVGAPPAAGWVALGPAPLISDQNFFGMVSGRSTAIAVDPSDATGNTVYAAGAYGGVWKSTNAANAVVANVTWTPVTDQQASLANGAVSVKPDGTVVLVGTGEPNNAIDSYYGVGILRSTNKGATWTLVPSADSGAHPFAGLGVSKFAWVPSSNTVVAATATSAKGFDEGDIGGSTNRGLYLSNDGGLTWAYQAPTDGSTPISVTDVVYNATAGKFFAAVRYHGVYSSTNGTSWTRLANQPNPTVLSTANCPVTVNNTNPCPMYRGQFTVVPGRNEMYFWFIDPFLQDKGIWQSLDGGTSWKQLQPASQCNLDPDTQNPPCGMRQPFYNLELSAMPNGTATDLYAGLVNLYKCRVNNGTQSCATIDSGLPNSWINLTQVYTCPSIAGVHPDEHGIDFEIVGGKAIMYFGNDGGVYRTLDGLTQLNSGTCGVTNQFEDLNATIGSMTQFVSFSTHPSDQNTVLGGTQDNGSPASSTATTSSLFFTANGGDGGYNAIDATNSLWYSANTDVSIQVCSTPPNCNSNNFNPVVFAGTGAIGGDFGAFYSPYILDPQDPAELLLGTCRVWRGSATPGSNFSTLSPNFDTGNTATCTGGEVNQIRAIAAGGPKDGSGFSNVVYATSDGLGPLGGIVSGLVGATTNAATTQMTDVTGSINPSSYSISSVTIDNSDATGKTVYVGIMGFHTSHVFKTTNAGGAWADWTGSGGTALPDSPVDSLLVDSLKGQIYAGTDVGIFVSSTSSASWTEVGPAPGSGQAGYLPNVPVSAIQMFNSGGTKKLRASTYGRGIWEYSLAAASATTTTLTSSLNPASQGAAVTFTATVTTTGTNPPTGTVTFNDGTTALGTGTLSTVGGFQVATFTTSTLAVGTHSITAVYGGDANNAGSTSLVLTQTITAVTTTTTLKSSLNPANAGVAVTFTATVTTTGAIPPTGTVTFNDGTTALGTGTLNGSQVATFTTSTLTAGTHSITAVYGGDANNAGSTSLALSQVIVAPTFTFVSNGSSSHTVLSGQTTLNYSFLATPTSGSTFASAVNLSCTSFSPADPTLTSSSCTFSPSATIAAGSPASTVTMTISSKGPNSGTGSPLNHRSDNRLPWLPLTLPLAGVVMVGFARRKMSRGATVAAMCLMLALAGFLIACGSSTPHPISVAVSGSASSIYPQNVGWTNSTATFTATLTNDSGNKGVTWAVTTPNDGTITSTDATHATYTPPTIAAGLPSNVTITATSVADPSKTGTASIALNPTTVPGTSTVTVTAAEAGATSQTANVTLVVK